MQGVSNYSYPGANMDCLKTSHLIFAAIALKDIFASVGLFLSSESSEKGTDLTSPVDKILISAIFFTEYRFT